MDSAGFRIKPSIILSSDVAGYIIPDKQSSFARKFIDNAGNNIIHEHSSHHVKTREENKGEIILYWLW
jgi:poly-gamma-glutamate capsule biosynthesis protein CapA/YwtB (metallophosphatase superfamily)